MVSTPDLEARFLGLLLGTAVGDALGLPAEGLAPSQIHRRWGGEWRHRLIFSRGLCSDDTEHTILVAQALLSHCQDARAFQRCLAWKLRWWLLGLPAGVGFATARAIVRLWLGFPPTRSGVKSAGNGPAMRSAILGLFFANDAQRRREFVSAATRLTHTDPKAGTAALAVAEAAAWAAGCSRAAAGFLARLPGCGSEEEWQHLCRCLSEAYERNETVAEFAGSLGLKRGVTGYAFHTVPVALYAWLRHPADFRAALVSVLDCGGDTDTAGAIVGALAGASIGPGGIPQEWVDGLLEWPRTVSVLRKLAGQLSEQKMRDGPLGPVYYFWPGLIPRNLVFLAVVLLHGFRRLLPPY